MQASSISAVVMTLNEKHNIEYCLRSIRPWADEVIVADMFSDDGTPEIARPYADRIINVERVEAFDAARKNAFETASGEWILSIDADEVITPQLADWIVKFVRSDPEFDVVLIPRANVFLGTWVRTSHWWPGKPRLFRKNALEVSAKLHHGLVPKPGARITKIPPDPDRSMWHFTFLSIHNMVDKTNRYTTIEAQQALEAGKGRPGVRELIMGPLSTIGVFILRRGYRDGMAGLAWIVDRMYYRFLASMKRWDQMQSPHRQAQYDEMRDKILSGFENGGRVARATIDASDAPASEDERVAATADAAR
jgi:(heptosyl)LPS beta-1,4-glucosyltransferase